MATRPHKVTYSTIHQLEHCKRMMVALPIVRKSKSIPWGYYEDPEDQAKYGPDYLTPDMRKMKALLQARYYIKRNYTYNHVAAWLTHDCGYSIQPRTLQKIIEVRAPQSCITKLTQEERERFIQSTSDSYFAQFAEKSYTKKSQERSSPSFKKAYRKDKAEDGSDGGIEG